MLWRVSVFLVWIVLLFKQPVRSSELNLNAEIQKPDDDRISYYETLQHLFNTKRGEGLTEGLKDFKKVFEESQNHQEVPNAINDFKKTLEKNPNQPIIFYKNYYKLLLEAGECDEAKIILKMFKEKLLSDRGRSDTNMETVEKNLSSDEPTSDEGIESSSSRVLPTRTGSMSNGASESREDKEGGTKSHELREHQEDRVNTMKNLIYATDDPRMMPGPSTYLKTMLPMLMNEGISSSSEHLLPSPRSNTKKRNLDEMEVRRSKDEMRLPQITRRKKKVKLDNLFHYTNVHKDHGTTKKSKKKSGDVAPAKEIIIVDRNSEKPSQSVSLRLDKFDWMAKTWVKELKNISNVRERIYAKKAIYETLFQAQLGLLHRNSFASLKNTTHNDNVSAAGFLVKIGIEPADSELTERTWICELRNIADSKQMLFAKKFTNDILFEAQMGTL